ncbi:hypothetical protein F2Q69_00011306 [Brassica cretica]|uniref:Uncharacterized protein n=1 Tax=Brassica cretica TaxID=69181 RepID=A0A8S9QVL1_BRACR|nr:hypothetical protein F2Q69_00011306 [Brassica cretica]
MISFVVSQKKDPSLQVQLLEYDMRFERYGNPPYLSKECLERVTQTVSFLASRFWSVQGTNRAYLFAGDAQRDRAAELLGVPCVFKPHLSSKLGNE